MCLYIMLNLYQHCNLFQEDEVDPDNPGAEVRIFLTFNYG